MLLPRLSYFAGRCQRRIGRNLILMRCVYLDGRRQLSRVPPTSSAGVRLEHCSGEARNLASQRPGFLMPCLEIVQMVGKHKSSGKTKRVARSEANLGQKDAELQKT